MSPDGGAIAERLAALLQVEAELITELSVEDGIVSGLLGREHPMAWRWLRDFNAVEALTLAAPSPAELDTLPHWRDPGWALSMPEIQHGQPLTLWWHAASAQAMLASQIPLDELRRDSVVSALRLHLDGLRLCQRRRLVDASAEGGQATADFDAPSVFLLGLA